MPCSTPLSQLPGDPSLVVYTNVDMGDKKSAFMVAASSAVAQCLGKPESYVSVCVLVRGTPCLLNFASMPCESIHQHTATTHIRQCLGDSSAIRCDSIGWPRRMLRALAELHVCLPRSAWLGVALSVHVAGGSRVSLCHVLRRCLRARICLVCPTCRTNKT